MDDGLYILFESNGIFHSLITTCVLFTLFNPYIEKAIFSLTTALNPVQVQQNKHIMNTIEAF